MDLFSSAAAAVGGDVAGSFLNHALAMRRQEQAQNFESDMFQKRYQMTVKDLQAAGLNPMLAYTQGVGSAPSSSAAGASSGSAGSDAVSAYNATKIASAQAALLQAQKKQVQEQTRSTKADADLKGPQATIMRTIENAINPFLGTTARLKSSAQMVGGKIERFFSDLFGLSKKKGSGGASGEW